MKNITIICNDGNKETYPFKRVTFENDVIEINVDDTRIVVIDPEDADSRDHLVKAVIIK